MKRVFRGFVLLLAISWCRALLAADTTPPQLVSLSLSATNLEVSDSNQAILITARITDDLSGMTAPSPGVSGVAFLSMEFLSPSRSQQASVGFGAGQRTSGNERDGIYTNQLVLPRYSESGLWTAQYASLRDAVGNERTLDYAAFVRLGIPAELNVTGNSDTSPPSFISLSFSPDSVDTSSSNRVQFTARLQDDLSGIAPDTGNYDRFSHTRAEFRSPSGRQGFSVIFFSSGRISGDAQDGVYTNSVLLPEPREPGVWTLESLSVRDAAGNQATLSGGQLLALGFPMNLTVTGESQTNDSTAPFLAGLSLTPTNINTTHSAQSILVTAHVTDDLSGFGIPLPFTTGGSGGVSAIFSSPSGHQSTNVRLGPRLPASAAVLDTVFTNTMALPRYSEPGLWLLQYLVIVDKAGNQRQLDLAAVRSLGLPHSFIVEEFPSLKIILSESTAIVSWPASAEGFTIQSSSSAADVAAWSDVLSLPLRIGDQQVIAAPLSPDQRYYRLIKRP